MSVVVGIDPSVTPGRPIAVRHTVGGWRVVPAGGRANQVVLSVPSELLTFRTLTLPFADRRRAELVAQQELSNSLALPLSEVRWSLCPLSRHEYLAVVSPRHKLDSLASSFKPDVADAEPFSYARGLAAAGIKDALVVHLDAGRTVFCQVVNQRPALVRVLLRGANPQAGRDAVDGLLTDAMLPPLPAGVGIYVTGSLAGQPILTKTLEERLQRPVKPFPVPEGLSSETDVSALGAALRSLYPDDGVDLLQHKRADRPQWIPWVVAAGVLLLLLSADLAMRLMLATRHSDQYSVALTSLLKTYNVTGMDDLKTKVAKLPAVQAGPDTGLLDMMAAVAEKAKGHDIRILEIHQAGGGFHLVGNAGTEADEEAFQRDLSGVYKDFQVEDTHPTRDSKTQFRFRIGGHP
ncbi:MAG TPA: hypothetical protein VGO93_00830 [Candidatus Xenobia bacterium]